MRTCVQPTPRLLLLVLVVVAGAGRAEGEGWQYHGEQGPQQWSERYPQCGGTAQSPINLDPWAAMDVGLWPRLHLHGYHAPPRAMTLRNTGHSVEVRVGAGSEVPRMSGGGLLGHYHFDQFHFHWAADAHRGGSEHTIEFFRHVAEMHLVHHDVRYGSLEEAVMHPQGVAVLAVFLALSSSDNPALNPIVRALDNVQHEGDPAADVEPFPLDQLLPLDFSEVFRYFGSLTTPPCHQSVMWTVFSSPITISQRQLERFQSLRSHESQPIQDNFRPLQPLYWRQVFRGSLSNHG